MGLKVLLGFILGIGTKAVYTSPPPAKKPHSTFLPTLRMLGKDRVVFNSGRRDYSELQCLIILDEDLNPKLLRENKNWSLQVT